MRRDLLKDPGLEKEQPTGDDYEDQQADVGCSKLLLLAILHLQNHPTRYIYIFNRVNIPGKVSLYEKSILQLTIRQFWLSGFKDGGNR